MSTKRCPTCKEIKDVSEFDKNRRNKDGIHSQCKKCKYADMARYRATEAGREDYRKRSKKYKLENRDKLNARKIIEWGIRSGKIIRPDKCQNCGIECRTEAHHHAGYDKLNAKNVKWLCKKCHSVADRQR